MRMRNRERKKSPRDQKPRMLILFTLTVACWRKSSALFLPLLLFWRVDAPGRLPRQVSGLRKVLSYWFVCQQFKWGYLSCGWAPNKNLNYRLKKPEGREKKPSRNNLRRKVRKQPHTQFKGLRRELEDEDWGLKFAKMCLGPLHFSF